LNGLERDGVEPPGSDADLIGRLQMLALDEGDAVGMIAPAMHGAAGVGGDTP